MFLPSPQSLLNCPQNEQTWAGEEGSALQESGGERLREGGEEKGGTRNCSSSLNDILLLCRNRWKAVEEEEEEEEEEEKRRQRWRRHRAKKLLVWIGDPIDLEWSRERERVKAEKNSKLVEKEEEEEH